MAFQEVRQLSLEEFCEAGARWSESEKLALLKLVLVDGLGTVLIRRLLAAFGTPTGVFDASDADLHEVPGIGPRIVSCLRSPRLDHQLEKELELVERLRTKLVWAFDPSYPQVLRSIASAPLLLFVRGELLPTDELAIGVVGSRMATAYGIQHTFRIAGQLAEIGFTIVSGLARGIDGAAHRAALRVGGRTIGVLASGLADIYPPDHFELAETIAERGALVSEAPMTQRPKSGLFPMRNRIISGLSLGIVVIEAARRSGAMITVGHALDQGREVFALPGPVHSPVSQGCHQLIREGAYLVESALDVYEVLREPALRVLRRLRRSERLTPGEEGLDDQARTLLQHLSNEPSSLDELVAATRLSAQEVMRAMTRLELRGLARRLPGARFCKSE